MIVNGCQTYEQTTLPIMRQLCLSIRRRRRRSHRRSLARSSSSGYLSPLQFRCSSSSLAIYAAVAVVVAQVSRVESIHVPCQVASQPHRVAVGRARSARRRRWRAVGGRRRLDRRTARGAVKARSVRRDRQAAARGLLAHRRRATTTAEAAAAVSCRAITRIRDGRTDEAESPFVVVVIVVVVARADGQCVRKSESPRRSVGRSDGGATF